MPRNCGHPDHVEPWMACEHCRRSSTFCVSLAGMSVKPDDYLPPMNELDSRRNEEASRVGGKRTVETFGG